MFQTGHPSDALLLPLPLLAAAPAGLILLGAALSKAIRARPLQAMLVALGDLPLALQTSVTCLLTAAQAALGILLLTTQAFVLPVLALFGFAVLKGITLWAKRRGRLEHCGCYGPFPGLPAPLAMGLDAVLLLSLLASCVLAYPLPSHFPALPVSAGALLLAGAVGLLTLRSLQIGALINFSPLQPGRPWPGTLPGLSIPVREDAGSEKTEPEPSALVPRRGTALIILVTETCTLCPAWLRVLRARAALGQFYPVTVLSGTRRPCTPTSQPPAPASALPPAPPSATGGDRFTVYPVPLPQLLALADEVPCAILVQDGIITGRWTLTLPPEWLTLPATMAAAATSPPGAPTDVPARPHAPTRIPSGHIPSGHIPSGQIPALSASRPRPVPIPQTMAGPAENHRYFSAGPV